MMASEGIVWITGGGRGIGLAGASMPPQICVNDILITPTWSRNFVGSGL